MSTPTIKHVRAFVLRGGGADYHDQGDGHWIDDHIATPMSKYPEYRQSRRSFGINVLGTLVVEIEDSAGNVGFSVTTGGEPAAYIVEKHLARFLEGAKVTDIEKIWDQMYLSSQYYGRKGLVINTISGIDLALWDLLGKVRQEPVHQLLGGAVRDELQFYATGARPDLAQKMGSLTQDDLAGLVGATRASVNQALQTLYSTGLVRAGRGRIEVTDVRGLRRYTR